MLLISANNIFKSYSGRQILNGANIEIYKGDCIGIIGRNGVGKTTLLRILAGLEMADSAYIVRDNSIRFGRVAILPSYHFVPNHLKVSSAMKLMVAGQCRHLQDEPLIEEYSSHRIHDLSVGIKRLIEVLLLLHSRAKIVLLDEPFLNVDPLHREVICDHIKKVAHAKGIVIIDHSYNQVLGVSTKFLYLRNGSTSRISASDLEDLDYLPK